MLDRITINQDFKPENPYAARHKGVIVNSICSQAFSFGDDMSRFKRTDAPLCACGCGGRVIRSKLYPYDWNKFIHGHYIRVNNPCLNKKPWNYGNDKYSKEKERARKEDPPICACGYCNERTKWNGRGYNKYILGHGTRGLNWKPKPLGSEVPLCGCGCGKRVKWNQGQNQWNKFIAGHQFRGENNWNYGKTEKLSPNYGIKRPKHSEFMKSLGDDHPWRNPEVCKRKSEYLLALGDNHPAKKPEVRKANSKRMTKIMLNGHAAYMNSFIRNPSKPQVELFRLVKLLYPTAILNHPSLNYSIDIALPDLMIAIEYDGSYWHQDREDCDRKRQRKLEKEGWKFLRYVDYVPPLDELKTDLQQTERH